MDVRIVGCLEYCASLTQVTDHNDLILKEIIYIVVLMVFWLGKTPCS